MNLKYTVMKKPTVKWESLKQKGHINEQKSGEEVYRAKVFGGWLVKAVVWVLAYVDKNNEAVFKHSMSITFVPDPTHDGWSDTSEPI